MNVGLDASIWINRRGFGRFTREFAKLMVRSHPEHVFARVVVHRLSTALAERYHRVDVYYSEDAYHLQHPDDREARLAEHPKVIRSTLRTCWQMLSA